MHKESWLDASDAERDDHFTELHPPCERCGDAVCALVTDGAHEDDCICHGSVPGGLRRDDLVFCGEVCAEAFGGADETQRIPVETMADVVEGKLR
jgi:hypothetical protein